MAASIGYVGTQTVHQLADRDINTANPGGANAGRPLFAPFGRTAATTMWDGFPERQLSRLSKLPESAFQRRCPYQRRLYIFSKAISLTDEDGWAGLLWNADNVIGRNRSATGYDRRHILQFGWVAELPFGPERSLRNRDSHRWSATGKSTEPSVPIAAYRLW
jgi:hypothetical protein